MGGGGGGGWSKQNFRKEGNEGGNTTGVCLNPSTNYEQTAQYLEFDSSVSIILRVAFIGSYT